MSTETATTDSGPVVVISDEREVKVAIDWEPGDLIDDPPDGVFAPTRAVVRYKDGNRSSIHVFGPLITQNGRLHQRRKGSWYSEGDPDESWPQVAIDALALVESTPDSA
jgi:hypothetical protein